MNEVDSTSRQWVQTRLRTVYKEGALRGEVASSFSWTQTHLNALYTLQKDTMSSVLSATRFVRVDTKRFIREMSKSQLLLKMTTGQTAIQAGRNIEKLLRERGIAAITYRNGSRHGLREYGEMLAVTKTAEAYNIGTLVQSEADTKYWEILDGPECGLEFHDDGSRADGMIVDRHTAEKFVISHPRCRRSFAPRPDLITKKDVREAKPSVTEAQRQDVRQADRARRELRSKSRTSTAHQSTIAESKTPRSLAEGERVRDLREQLGLSRPELSQQTGISVAKLHGIEHGRPLTPDERARLERVLGQLKREIPKPAPKPHPSPQPKPKPQPKPQPQPTNGAHDPQRGATLRQLRENAGMSRTELSKETGISVARLAGIEQGRPLTLDELTRITEATARKNIVITPKPSPQPNPGSTVVKGEFPEPIVEGPGKFIGYPARELDRYFADTHGLLTDFGSFANRSKAQEIANTLDQLLTKYPQPIKSMQRTRQAVANMTGRSNAQVSHQVLTKTNTLRFNKEFSAFSPAQYAERFKKWGTNGWWTPGGNRISSIVAHEYGHLMRFVDFSDRVQMGRAIGVAFEREFGGWAYGANRAEFRTMFGVYGDGLKFRNTAAQKFVEKHISKYATTNFEEMVAESFAEVQMYGVNARPAAKVVYQTLMSMR